MAVEPEQLARDIYKVDGLGLRDAINVLLVREDDGFTLIDTGLSGSVKRIEAALAALGSGLSDLKRIFLTHHHSDHVGGLEGLLSLSGAKVWASDREAEVFTGERPPDPESSRVLRRVNRNFKPPRVEVSRRLRDGESVAGLRTIPTPGHTLGHVSLLRDEDGFLFTADAFGRFPFLSLNVGVQRAFCADPALAKRSAGRLLTEDFHIAAFAHGRTLREDAGEKLRRVVEACSYT